MAAFTKGDVVRVAGWPATVGKRFVVEQVVEVPGSPYPLQVHCRELGRGWRVGVFRAFPAENCRLDPKAARLRRVAVGVILAVIVAVLARPAVATAMPAGEVLRGGPICDIDWREGTKARIRLIRCAVSYWPVPGGWKKAVRVARCESFPELRPDAVTGVHVGIYQLSGRYYDRWYRLFGKPLGLARSRFNARTNIIVAIRMANAWGWDAWSCA